MKLRSQHTLDPTAQRELEAIDAALAGEPVAGDLVEVARLVDELQVQRPQPAGEFIRELDRRAAGGFAGATVRASGRTDGRARRIGRALRTRQGLVPALGVLGSLAVAVAISVPLLRGLEQRSSTEAAPTAPPSGGDAVQPAPVPQPSPLPRADTGAGLGQANRRVERQASLSLVAPADRVDDIADGIVRVTDRAGGIVVSSSVEDSDSGRAGANFDLRVPNARLSEALAGFSRLAHVRSRTESSQDITGNYGSARERLRESLAERRALLRQLAQARTPNQVESIRASLRIVAAEITSGRAAVARLGERSSFSSVTVSIGPEEERSGDTGAWTPGDALHDSLRILEIAAGVALVTLAVAIPAGFVFLAGAYTARLARRRRREHALEHG